jgi:hypothetical protein
LAGDYRHVYGGDASITKRSYAGADCRSRRIDVVDEQDRGLIVYHVGHKGAMLTFESFSSAQTTL